MWLESKTLLQSWCGCLAFTKSPSISFFPWVHHCEKSALLVSKPGRAGDIAAVFMEVRERSSAQHLPTWPGSSVLSPQLGSRPRGAVDALAQGCSLAPPPIRVRCSPLRCGSAGGISATRRPACCAGMKNDGDLGQMWFNVFLLQEY